jgi:hypothetical protein
MGYGSYNPYQQNIPGTFVPPPNYYPPSEPLFSSEAKAKIKTGILATVIAVVVITFFMLAVIGINRTLENRPKTASKPAAPIRAPVAEKRTEPIAEAKKEQIAQSSWSPELKSTPAYTKSEKPVDVAFSNLPSFAGASPQDGYTTAMLTGEKAADEGNSRIAASMFALAYDFAVRGRLPNRLKREALLAWKSQLLPQDPDRERVDALLEAAGG